MERNRYEGICEVASHGEIKWVDNTKTGKSGRVVSCSGEKLQVETEGHRERWDSDQCRERTYGYMPVYGSGK
ncbi:hypothetical protein DESUT3_31730 [Desulfuromonas versatilis]|uniref:Hypervirulence associated protein TUDOR domain-containing protein n=1 Tax=Desulfuromonas versatilis TaxID=2802975 RepID=A0ABM8HVT7_9BACT|nr:hypothetical protein [Desulfuromonas versatilis]BCR06104.1 hypothetical protein DESUT3_31730 [Desulfuromonas versatilis]